MENYHVIGLVGEGSFGKVREAVCVEHTVLATYSTQVFRPSSAGVCKPGAALQNIL